MKIVTFKLSFLFLLMVLMTSFSGSRERPGSFIELILNPSASAITAPIDTKKPTQINYVITAQGHFGDITSTSTRKDLVRLFGAVNVKDGDIIVEEGQTQKATIVFPNNSAKRVEIIWQEKGLKTPQTIRISGDVSKWHLANGLTLNDPLLKVEKYNQHPFKLYGFEWDYGGYVTDWQHGKMENFNSKHTHLMLRFSPAASYEGLSEKEISSVSGEGEFLSSNLTLRKMNPKISQIIVSFY
jgi:hypothetical protein